MFCVRTKVRDGAVERRLFALHATLHFPRGRCGSGAAMEQVKRTLMARAGRDWSAAAGRGEARGRRLAAWGRIPMTRVWSYGRLAVGRHGMAGREVSPQRRTYFSYPPGWRARGICPHSERHRFSVGTLASCLPHNVRQRKERQKKY